MGGSKPISIVCLYSFSSWNPGLLDAAHAARLQLEKFKMLAVILLMGNVLATKTMEVTWQTF